MSETSNPMASQLFFEERKLLCTSLLGSVLVNYGNSISIQARHLLESLLGADTWNFHCEQFCSLLEHWDTLGNKERNALVLIASRVVLFDYVTDAVAEKLLLKLVRAVVRFRDLVECKDPVDESMMNAWLLFKEYVAKKFGKAEMSNTCSQIIFYISLKAVYTASTVETPTHYWKCIVSCAESIISTFLTVGTLELGFCCYQTLEMLKDTISDRFSCKRHIEHFWNRLRDCLVSLSSFSVIASSIPFEIEMKLRQLSIGPPKPSTEFETFFDTVTKEGVVILDLIRYIIHQISFEEKANQNMKVLIGLVQHSMTSMGIRPTSKAIVEPLMVVTQAYIEDSSATALRASLYKFLHVLFREHNDTLHAILMDLTNICEENAAYSYRIHECLHFDMYNDIRVKKVFTDLCKDAKICSLCKKLGIVELQSPSTIDLTDSDEELKTERKNVTSTTPLTKNAGQSKQLKRKQSVKMNEKVTPSKKMKILENGQTLSLNNSSTRARGQGKFVDKERRVPLETNVLQQNVISEQSSYVENGSLEQRKEIVSDEVKNKIDSTGTAAILQKTASTENNFAALAANVEREEEKQNNSTVEDVTAVNVPLSDKVDSESTISSCSYSTAVELDGSAALATNEEPKSHSMDQEEIISTSQQKTETTRDKELKNFADVCKKFLSVSDSESVVFLPEIVKEYSRKEYFFPLIQQELAEIVLDHLEDEEKVRRIKKLYESIYVELIRERAHRMSSLLSLTAEFLYIIREKYKHSFQDFFHMSRTSVLANLISQGPSGFVKLQHLYQLLCLEESEMQSVDAKAFALVQFNQDMRILSFSFYRDDALGFLLDVASIFPEFIRNNLEFFELLTLVMKKDNMKTALELFQNGTIQMFSFHSGEVKYFYEFLKRSFEWGSCERQTYLWKLLLKDISIRLPEEQKNLAFNLILKIRTELSLLSLDQSRALLEVFSDWIILQKPDQRLLFSLFELGEPFSDMVSDIVCAWLVKSTSHNELVHLFLNSFIRLTNHNKNNYVFVSRVSGVLRACCRRLPFFQFLNTKEGKPLLECCQQMFQGEEIVD
ncbi:hypothetical protein Gasu2_03460 [Galdieria sulphuraria]|nr:hypothetical protein Gasu2_03460 [Galdieria sulphuraria]